MTTSHHRIGLLALFAAVVPACANAEPIKSGCPLLPFEQRANLTQACQKKLYEADMESARFKECFRILGLDGLRNGRCDSRAYRYVPDVNAAQPSILVLRPDGTPYAKLPLEKGSK
jgi:hypothetical protein